MPYPEELVTPMRKELSDIGFEELKTAEDVKAFLDNQEGSAIIVFNSVCGCAAGGARPGIKRSLEHAEVPAQLKTVFAGQDIEAAKAVRAHFSDLPPSSPSAIIIEDGEVVEYYPRHKIEGYTPEQIANNLTKIYDQLKKPQKAA